MSRAVFPEAAVPWALGGFLAIVLLQRMVELAISAINARKLRARGAREFGRDHFPLLVLVHALYPLALAAEVLLIGARPGVLAPLWLTVWVAAQGLRVAAIRALGERWNVRIWVVPGAPLVKQGPYRVLRHPNYVAVVAELIAGPMLFGAWRTAIVISALNLVALRNRVRAEERALAGSV